MSIIEVKDAGKEYGGQRVVDHLNLQIGEGQIYGLLGPNGAGKSTTIRMICNIIRPDFGEIRIYGHDISREFSLVQKKIGLVPQNIALYQQYTAEENIKLFGELYGLRGASLKRGTEKALEMTGLEQVAKKQSGTFSGGMLRRLNIACALVHSPKILIMDEPTVGIDPQSRNYILEAIKARNEEGTTIIYCSHYMEEVEALCTMISVLDKGKEIAKGPKEELKQQVGKNKTLLVTGGAFNEKLAECLRGVPGVLSVNVREKELAVISREQAENLSEIIDRILQSGASVSDIQYSDVTLETVFLALTGKKLRD